MKRLVDITVGALALVVLAPLLLAVSVAVLADSGRPILFRQRRVGRNFQTFWLLKFRSMRANSSGASITVSGDRRITRIGRLLRITKLDELPQFWNVLRGEMSLVGPRPEVPEYVQLFQERYRRVLAVRPGITDLASISFRNEEEILSGSPDPIREYVERILPAKLSFAEQYVSTHTLLGDLRILVLTAVSVVKGV